MTQPALASLHLKQIYKLLERDFSAPTDYTDTPWTEAATLINKVNRSIDSSQLPSPNRVYELNYGLFKKLASWDGGNILHTLDLASYPDGNIKNAPWKTNPVMEYLGTATPDVGESYAYYNLSSDFRAIVGHINKDNTHWKELREKWGNTSPSIREWSHEEVTQKIGESAILPAKPSQISSPASQQSAYRV